MAELPDGWKLDEPSTNGRVRMNGEITKKASGNAPTRHTQFRMPEIQARRLDELLAGRYDPTITTKTDILIDAVGLWIDEWDKQGKPDGANGNLRTQWALYKMKLERVIRDDFLKEAKSQLEELKHEGDVRRLHTLREYVTIAIADSQLEPPSYLRELDSVLEQTTRLIEAADVR